jgi:acetoin:2,6-dichlorophenolindophenol oxidoreductase subunit alpha
MSQNQANEAFTTDPLEREVPDYYLPNILLHIWDQTCLNHYFEQEVAKAHRASKLKLPIYLSLGQEHLPAAVAAAKRDWPIFVQHRCHSYYLSFGGDPHTLVDELLGKPTGCTGGRGGSASIHIPNVLFGHSGFIGDQVPIAVGMALGTKEPVLAVFGDAAAEEDYVLGALGFAVTKHLPILFLCEDNDLSILTHKSARRSWDIVDAARGFGMKAINIEDDPLWVYFTVLACCNLDILPVLININVCRHLWHAGSGTDGEPKWNRFELFRQSLISKGLESRIKQIEERNREAMAELWQRQLQSQKP